jgi:uncharacterized protein (DUF608 family)
MQSKHIGIYMILILALVYSCTRQYDHTNTRAFNSAYSGPFLNRIAFPIGGIGAGMICLEGTGAVSHVSVRNKPDIFNAPLLFAALCVKQDKKNIAKIMEGPIPDWKYFGMVTPGGSGNGMGGTSYGLPRFQQATFTTRFPFAHIALDDPDIPLRVNITGWSPFIPGDADNSSLPVGELVYQIENPTGKTQEAVFSFNSENFMHIALPSEWGGTFEPGESIKAFTNGFLLWQDSLPGKTQYEGGFAFWVDDTNVKINHRWFRGGWFDPLSITWKNIQEATWVENPPVEGKVAGASLFVPFALKSNETKTIRLKFCWYVPNSDLRRGADLQEVCLPGEVCTCVTQKYYKPWYAGRFKTIQELAKFWNRNGQDLHDKTHIFSESFYTSTLPPEVLEAVAANLTILKSPTILRQIDGKLWGWEGCHDDAGCCHGSCTHVWNYAQAIPHLFPDLERSLRQTEFTVSQNDQGHQQFRSSMPIRPADHGWHAAADGQLGGIMKVYREWRISGDTEWLKSLWPRVKESMHYCIETWDPRHKGITEEPHHNTYDIEFWGPDGMCTSFYLGALTAMIKMADALSDDGSLYRALLQKGKTYMETELYNDEYFIQKIVWEGLMAPNPIDIAQDTWNINYSPEALELLTKEGPKYQYGDGCLSDGILGLWIARVCGIEDAIISQEKVKHHLNSVHRYNLRQNLLNHANPMRPGYALGKDGGLLLCSWPKGAPLSLPFPYSKEVWTGIEYQVASHLMFEGMVEEGLEIVRLCRKRYDGRVRNPFNEYECGHWYARALASYGLLQGLTGIRYDAVEQILYIDSKIGPDFTSFLATETGFANAGLSHGKPFMDLKMGKIPIRKYIVSGEELTMTTN